MHDLPSVYDFPFSTKLAITTPPTKQGIEAPLPGAKLSLQFKLVLKEPIAKDIAMEVKEILDVFLSAVSRGLFGPTETLGIGAAQDQTENITLQYSNGSCIEASGEIKELPVAAYRVLFCLLAQTHYAIAPLSRLELIISESTISPKLLSEPFSIPFPEATLAGPNRFDIDLISEPEEVDEITVRIVLVNEESARFFDLIEDILADWDSIIAVGGYRDSFSPLPDIIHYPWETSISDQFTIEHQINIFTGGKDEINGLLLMMSYVDSFVARIARIEIE